VSKQQLSFAMAPKGKEKKSVQEVEADIVTTNRPNILDTLFPPWSDADIAADKVDPKGRSWRQPALFHLVQDI
jgi:hypothetical protein